MRIKLASSVHLAELDKNYTTQKAKFKVRLKWKLVDDLKICS